MLVGLVPQIPEIRFPSSRCSSVQRARVYAALTLTCNAGTGI